ncbi:MAG: aminotransferase class I/II-fold pyridoxal phosphate-dependent enzyme [Myxococcota bacterium]
MDKIYLSPPHMGSQERDLLLDAFDSNWIAPLGPHVTAFETELAQKVGVEHAAALSSGSAALHLALLLLDIGPGDEVLVSSFTFAATVNAIRYVGASPVLIDSDDQTWNMSPDLLAEELASCAERGRLPKAVVVVDLYGQCADYDRLNAVCFEYNVPIIEDAAEALGATYRGQPAGSLGAMGVFSFNGNKIITTSGGGMLVSSRRDWIERARYLATQARQPVIHYEHTDVGYNYRLSNLLAAVGRGQLRVLEERVAQRRANNLAYRQALADVPGICFMPEADYGVSSCWLTVLQIDPEIVGISRDDLCNKMALNSIEARPAWKPMHLQPVFSECRRRGGDVSEALFRTGLCLPSGSNLTDIQRDRVIDTLRQNVRSADPS